MPIEILEKIIALALPDAVQVIAWYYDKDSPCILQIATCKQHRPFEWRPDWIPGLLLVSRTVRRIARKILAQRVDFEARRDYPLSFFGRGTSGKVEKDFSELLVRDEEHGLPTSRITV